MQRAQGFKPLVVVIAFVAAFALFGAVWTSSKAIADDTESVTVERAWARPAPQGGNGAVYFDLFNHGDKPVTLIAVTSDIAAAVEIHETTLISDDHEAHGDDHHHADDHHADHHHGAHAGAGTFIMQHVEQLEIPAEGHVAFQPSGHHVMLINLHKTLAWDASFPITLHFSEAPSITVWVKVGDEPVSHD